MMVGLRDMDHAGAVLSPFIERIAVILVGLLIHACKKIDDIPFDYSDTVSYFAHFWVLTTLVTFDFLFFCGITY